MLFYKLWDVPARYFDTKGFDNSIGTEANGASALLPKSARIVCHTITNLIPLSCSSMPTVGRQCSTSNCKLPAPNQTKFSFGKLVGGQPRGTPERRDTRAIRIGVAAFGGVYCDLRSCLDLGIAGLN